MVTSNIVKVMMNDGTIDIPLIEAARADVVFIRDHCDQFQIGNADERKLFTDLAACLCAFLALE